MMGILSRLEEPEESTFRSIIGSDLAPLSNRGSHVDRVVLILARLVKSIRRKMNIATKGANSRSRFAYIRLSLHFTLA